MKYAIIAGIVFITACTHKSTTEELLSNTDTRDSIMQAICNDQVMAKKMINSLENSNAADLLKNSCNFMKSKKAGQLIKNDTAMRNLLISNIMFLINSDSVLCDKTCTEMFQNLQSNAVLKAKMNPKRK